MVEFQQYPVEYRAGGIVRRQTGDTFEYLLVTSNSNRERWVIPAGHIEVGETRQEAALREVLEEAGVTADPLADLGHFQYTWYRNHQRITINTSLFLMEYVATVVLHPEGREVRFFNYDAIVSLNIWEESKEFLRKAHQMGYNKGKT